jgi:GWxTD domain-containing protein
MRLLFFLILATPFVTTAQALRDINYSYLYNNSNPITISFQTVRNPSSWTTFFQMVSTDTTQQISDYEVRFETRASLGEKEGSVISSDSIGLNLTSEGISARVITPMQPQPVILAARVTNRSQNRAWYYYTILEPRYPVVLALEANGRPVTRNYLSGSDGLSVTGSQRVQISYYEDVFPPAPLPFSEQLGRVSRGMAIDSSFQMTPNETFLLEQPGLYLLQTDTSAAEGLAFRIDDDYPRYRRVENLAEPLIYICTKQEFNRIKQARGDKRAFDRVILSITKDADRAKTLMRNYFRRVELANTYFSSYKEGWKTDRGMILIIFGQPSEVYRLGDREVWNYKNESYKLTFEFTKAPSLFDPENYVLIRSKKFEQPWYEVVDLWRNSRY